MKFLNKSLSAIFAFCCLLIAMQTAQANESEAELKTKLYQTIDNLNAAMAKGDFSVLVNSLPPKFINQVAIEGHTTEQALRTQFEAVIKGSQQESQKKLNHIKIDRDKAVVTVKPQQTYAVLPMTRMEEKGTLISTAIGLYEDGKWYVIYGGPRVFQNPVFVKIYPFLQDLKLAPDQWTATTKN